MSTDDTGHEPFAFEREAWTARGACRGTDTAVFYPGAGNNDVADRARDICATCPVAVECLDYALRTKEMFGIWGGTSERERRRLRRAAGITRPAAASVDYDALATVACAAIERGESAARAVMEAFGVTDVVAAWRIKGARRNGYDIPYEQNRVA